MKKPIEVEGQEMAFKKVGNRYKLVKDFAGKPSHEEGGHPILAEEGMVITPAKDRKKVTNMVDNKTGFVKNNARFNSYRLTLPKDDVAGKAKDGVNDFGKAEWIKNEGINAADYQAFIDKNYPEFKTKNLTQLYPGREMDNAINIRKQFMAERDSFNNRDKSDIKKASMLTSSKQKPVVKPVDNARLPIDYGTPENPFAGLNVNADKTSTIEDKPIGGNTNSSSLLANAGRTVPIVYDLMKGSQPIEKVSRRFMNPQLEGYQDLSEPLRQQVKTNTYGAGQQAGNLSGGSTQAVRVMVAANAGQSMRDLTDIQNTEVGRKLDTRNRNIERLNQSQGANLGLANQYDDIEARRRGAAQAFTRQGMTDIGALSKDMGTEKYMRDRDQKAVDVELLRMKHQPKWNVDTKLFEFDPEAGNAYERLYGRGRKGQPGLLEKKEKGTKAIKVPKYKKGTRYKSC